MTIRERIALAQKRAADRAAAMQKILDAQAARTGDEAAPTAEERAAMVTIRNGLDADEAEVQELIAQERALVQSAAIAGAGIAPTLNPDPTNDPQRRTPDIDMPEEKLAPGIAFARYVQLMVAAQMKGGGMQSAPEILKQLPEKFQQTRGLQAVVRAAVAAGTTTGTTWGAPLVVQNTLASEFVDLVRSETVIGRMKPNMRKVPFNFKFLKKTQGAVVGWVGEGMSKPVSSLGYEGGAFPWAKIAGIVPFTDELLRFGDPNVEAMVRDDLKEAILVCEDTTFLDNTAASSIRPAGIQNIIPNGNEFAATGTSVADIAADLAKAILLATKDGKRLNKPVWVMSPRTAAYLTYVRTSQDSFGFKDEMLAGRLMGFPVITSSYVPANLGGGADESVIYLISQGDLMLADDGEAQIDVSREASLQFDTSPATPPTSVVSLWQQNMIAVRAEVFIYWAARITTTHAAITGVPY